MDIKTLSKKLRHAADVLDELLGFDLSTKKETPQTALKMLSHVKRVTKKGYTYKGTHWTQKPENKERLVKMLRKASKARQA
jgi:hypothetical protein